MAYVSVLPRDMPFHLLEEITDGFSEERKLGSGAYGKVYMVQLRTCTCMVSQSYN